MKFDFVIGNPPYQKETIGENESYAPPVYDKFIDAACEIGEAVELITPARFLFNAGSTPKEWNRKMLNDEHFKVLMHEQNSKNIFPNTDIKGGVAITYRDKNKNFGKIELYTSFPELNSIIKKLKFPIGNLCTIIYAAESYHFTQKMHDDFPEIEAKLSKGHKFDLKSNVFEKLNQIVFFDNKKDDDYISLIGRKDNQRIFMYINKKYISHPDNFNNYKVLLPNANGSGALGEILTTPLIGEPLIGHTQTFLSIGKFDSKEEANNCMKYIKTKFCRCCLGVLKVTQSNSRPVWKYVPLQDFTDKSDIDWSKSIKEIDQQLYKKYGLSEDEIKFIEEKVKEME